MGGGRNGGGDRNRSGGGDDPITECATELHDEDDCSLPKIASRVSAGPARGPARPRVHAAGKRLAPRIRRRAVRAMA